jgi:multiple sugar transport system substrate-binding protein
MKPPSVVAALFGLASLLTAGCSSGPRQHELDDQGRIVIRFWNGFTGPDGKTMEALVRRFRAQNPDVVVRTQIIPWGTYYDKLTLALAYRGGPDVFVLHAGRLPEFASFGTLQPLGPLLAASAAPLGAADFASVPWRASFYQGTQYALPLDVHPVGLYYNTRLFEAAGLVDRNGRAVPPWDWESFLSAAQKLTRDTDGDGRPDQWGFIFTWPRSNWLTFAAQFDAGILTSDNRACAMASPENVAALQRMHDLIYRYHVAPKPEAVDAWPAFRQGRVGMALEGIYQVASLQEQTDLAYAGAPVPRFGPHQATFAGSHLLCQPAGIGHVRSLTAWRLMRFLSDNSLEWARGGQVPARLSVLRSPEFQALPVQAEFARELPYARYEPLTPRINAIFPFVDPAVDAVLLDLQTPDMAAREACRRIDQVLARP